MSPFALSPNGRDASGGGSTGDPPPPANVSTTGGISSHLGDSARERTCSEGFWDWYCTFDSSTDLAACWHSWRTQRPARHLRLLLVVGVGHGFASVASAASGLLWCFALCCCSSGVLVYVQSVATAVATAELCDWCAISPGLACTNAAVCCAFAMTSLSCLAP